jgi:hypothetical protein
VSAAFALNNLRIVLFKGRIILKWILDKCMECYEIYSFGSGDDKCTSLLNKVMNIVVPYMENS